MRALEIRNRLMNLNEEAYKKFTSKLIPGCDNILGVRIPIIRELAKEISKDDPVEYLRSKEKEKYHEEIMLKALIIGELKLEINEVLEEVSFFVPKIDNWSVCDSFCSSLKIVKKSQAKVWEFLKKYYKSNKPYHIRFAVVLMLFHFVNKEYIANILRICNEIKNEDYYVKMAVAWAICECFAKFPIETMEYLKNNNLDKETYNKALQKIRESNRVNKETKEIIKMMKI